MLCVVGTSHKCARVCTLEAIARAFSSWEKEHGNGVFLLTCNRAEWYFHSKTPAKAHQELICHIRAIAGEDALSQVFTFFGKQCFHHLGRVVCGLDSAFVGETEIQGQVKTAYDQARLQHNLPKEIHFLFQKALRTGKVIRQQMLPWPLENDLKNQVVEIASSYLSQHNHCGVLVVGASSINRRIALALHEKTIPLTLCNRTHKHAIDFAKNLGCSVVPWNQLKDLCCQFPCVISATRSPTHLLSDLPQHGLPQLFIDLGVPRNIDPRLSSSKRQILTIDSFSSSQNQELQSLDGLILQRTSQDYLCLSQRLSPYPQRSCLPIS